MVPAALAAAAAPLPWKMVLMAAVACESTWPTKRPRVAVVERVCSGFCRNFPM